LPAVKTLTVSEAREQLGSLIAEAARGDVIVVTDGDNQVLLTPNGPQRAPAVEEDGPELEATLLPAVRSPHRPLGKTELRELAQYLKAGKSER
jgi:antitoxin (DNA-binding transcriptional repressor) of toxin-antitoxin stability system